MIKEKRGKEDKAIYVYKDPGNEEKKEFFDGLISVFKRYANDNGIDTSKVEFDFKLINEIFIRVNKREDYYIIFHEETYLSEVRKVALIAFWLLKFKPFLITSDEGRDYNLNINCGFAAYIMLSAVSEDIEREYKGEKILSIDKEYLKKLRYAFKYWDLSKEAVMLIAETLCKCVEDKDKSEE